MILEIKATAAFIAEHQAQTLHYLTAIGLWLTLILNFGFNSLRFKRIILQVFKSMINVPSVAFLFSYSRRFTWRCFAYGPARNIQCYDG